jgi:hypothetical protein
MAHNHLTVVPENADGGADDEDSAEDSGVQSNYGVVRGHGARTTESPDESGDEVLS